MKHTLYPLAAITGLLLGVVGLALAQEGAPTPPIVPAPDSAQALAVALITAATPMLLALVKWAVPLIPKNILPFLAPMAGPLAEVMLQALTGVGVSPLVAAFAGLAGVGLREGANQVTQRWESVQTAANRKASG